MGKLCLHIKRFDITSKSNKIVFFERVIKGEFRGVTMLVQDLP